MAPKREVVDLLSSSSDSSDSGSSESSEEEEPLVQRAARLSDEHSGCGESDEDSDDREPEEAEGTRTDDEQEEKIIEVVAYGPQDAAASDRNEVEAILLQDLKTEDPSQPEGYAMRRIGRGSVVLVRGENDDRETVTWIALVHKICKQRSRLVVHGNWFYRETDLPARAAGRNAWLEQLAREPNQLLYTNDPFEVEAKFIRHPASAWFLPEKEAAPAMRCNHGQLRHTQPRPGFLVRHVYDKRGNRVLPIASKAFAGKCERELRHEVDDLVKESRARLAALQHAEAAHDRAHALVRTNAAPFLRPGEAAALAAEAAVAAAVDSSTDDGGSSSEEGEDAGEEEQHTQQRGSQAAQQQRKGASAQERRQVVAGLESSDDEPVLASHAAAGAKAAAQPHKPAAEQREQGASAAALQQQGAQPPDAGAVLAARAAAAAAAAAAQDHARQQRQQDEAQQQQQTAEEVDREADELVRLMPQLLSGDPGAAPAPNPVGAAAKQWMRPAKQLVRRAGELPRQAAPQAAGKGGAVPRSLAAEQVDALVAGGLQPSLRKMAAVLRAVICAPESVSQDLEQIMFLRLLIAWLWHLAARFESDPRGPGTAQAAECIELTLRALQRCPYTLMGYRWLRMVQGVDLLKLLATNASGHYPAAVPHAAKELQRLWHSRMEQLKSQQNARKHAEQAQQQQDQRLLHQSPQAAKALDMATSGRRLSALGVSSGLPYVKPRLSPLPQSRAATAAGAAAAAAAAGAASKPRVEQAEQSGPAVRPPGQQQQQQPAPAARPAQQQQQQRTAAHAPSMKPPQQQQQQQALPARPAQQQQQPVPAARPAQPQQPAAGHAPSPKQQQQVSTARPAQQQQQHRQPPARPQAQVVPRPPAPAAASDALSARWLDAFADKKLAAPPAPRLSQQVRPQVAEPRPQALQQQQQLPPQRQQHDVPERVQPPPRSFSASEARPMAVGASQEQPRQAPRSVSMAEGPAAAAMAGQKRPAAGMGGDAMQRRIKAAKREFWREGRAEAAVLVQPPKKAASKGSKLQALLKRSKAN